MHPAAFSRGDAVHENLENTGKNRVFEGERMTPTGLEQDPEQFDGSSFADNDLRESADDAEWGSGAKSGAMDRKTPLKPGGVRDWVLLCPVPLTPDQQAEITMIAVTPIRTTLVD